VGEGTCEACGRPSSGEHAPGCWVAEHGLEAGGDCYVQAGNLVTHPFDRAWDGWLLVHGRPTLQVPPHRKYGHAWLEHDGPLPVQLPSGLVVLHVGAMVHDPTVDVTVPRDAYYRLGQIDPAECRRYTREEASRIIVREGTWGPWHEGDA